MQRPQSRRYACISALLASLPRVTSHVPSTVTTSRTGPSRRPRCARSADDCFGFASAPPGGSVDRSADAEQAERREQGERAARPAREIDEQRMSSSHHGSDSTARSHPRGLRPRSRAPGQAREIVAGNFSSEAGSRRDKLAFHFDVELEKREWRDSPSRRNGVESSTRESESECEARTSAIGRSI